MVNLSQAASLQAVLLEETNEVQVFVELLSQEQTLLSTAGTAESLLPLVERKSICVARLKTLSDRREQLLLAGTGQAGRGAMDAWLALNPPSDEIRSMWKELLALAAEAKSLNETNGKLIRIHWKHNQAALAALMSAANRAMTYGPDGQQKAGGGGRSFGSA